MRSFFISILFALFLGTSLGAQNPVNSYAFVSDVSYDADAQAFFDVNTGLTTGQKTAINDLVIGLKANGTWSKYRAIYPIIGGTASAHKWNLKDPRDLDAAFRLTFNGTWTHNSSGMKGDGTTANAETHFVDSDHWTDAGSYIDCTIGYYSNLDIAGDSSSNNEMGADTSDNSKELVMQVNDGGGIYGRIYNSTSISVGTADNTRWVVANALSGSAQFFENGSPLGSVQTQGTNSFSGQMIYINSSRAALTTAIMSPRRCAFAVIGDGLTNTEIANDYTVIQAYQTALGRNN